MVSDIFKFYKNIKRKYISAFLLIFVFTILGQVIIQFFIHNQEQKSYVINLAGRQRMLSQKIAKSTLLLYFSSANASNVKMILAQDILEFQSTHNNLKYGNEVLGIEPPFTPAIENDYLELDKFVDAIIGSAKCFLDDCEKQDVNIKVLSEMTSDFLIKMNSLVYKSDAEIKKSIQTLSVIEYFVFIIIALIMLYEFFLVLLPFQKNLLTHFKLQMKEEAEKERVYHMAEVGEISSEVLHEINNFMTVVNIATGIIKNKANSDSDKANETLGENLVLINKIEKNVSNIVNLSSGMLKMTRVDDITTFYLVDILNEIREMLDDKIEALQVDFCYEFDTLLEVSNYRIKLTQILYNLVKNSIYALHDIKIKKIVITAIRQNDDLLIEVSDMGAGIPDELVDKIMNPFFTTKAAGKGTGLGLSLSQKLANNLGGKLILKSKRDPTIFLLRIKTAIRTENV